ncbi:tripeptidyl-peptidase 2 isoform X2 [Sesamum indicum]|uniref:tripeptidyl-peptidase II n=1 Tax=Sesamum indicum TaxID=4182 RepID=A0A6I9T6S4_SESIN|nr:tripeptidyl-peptidase 2 isoform X2 [Sesamum indicum]
MHSPVYNSNYNVINFQSHHCRLSFLSLPLFITALKPPRTARERKYTDTVSKRFYTSNSFRTRAMPSGEDNGALRNFKLNESTFLASLMPKKEIAADRFVEAHPEYDGRGVVIAIFDSGVDPAAAGLKVTSEGKPKILDVIDCTGSGDIDTSTIVKADDKGCIRGTSGNSLVVNSSWKNPLGEWHVGCKLVYELFTNTLTDRLKKERKKKWDEKNQEAIAEAVKQLDEFDKKHTKVDDTILKRKREDLQSRVDFLRKQAESYDDKGPIIDAVVWNDGEVWRAALDTQGLEDESGCGKLADFVPLTNYRIERKYGIFSKLDACTVVLNIYNEGNVLSIVTDSSPHGTHVAGITSAYHPKEPLLNGVAPGAQLISCKIGDSRLGSMETGTGLVRALIAAVEHKCDLINMSYGEPTLLPDYGRFVDLVNEVVNKHRLIFISSAGNNGPALSTVGAPGGTTSSIIGVGAYVSPAMAAGAHNLVEAPPEGLEYTWSSRGPTVDGDLGVCISAAGGAMAPVPTWTLQHRMFMNGTSMSSPCACGGVALLISAMKAEGVPVSPYSVREALENTSIPVGDSPEDKLSAGQGLMQVDKAYDYIQKSRDIPSVRYQIKITQSGKSTPTSRGIYLREADSCQRSTEWTVKVEPKFHDDASNLDELVPFEECVKLQSSGEAVVRAPEYLLLTHNGREFNIIVDPTTLNDGLHYYEVYALDCRSPWRGPLFRIPITITKPQAVKNRPPIIVFQGLSFVPGHIERKFVEVPIGATWVEVTVKTSGFTTARRFFIDSVQISPLQRPIKWETVATFSSPSSKSFAFAVEGGRTMELAIAQFWSSGVGSHHTTSVDFEIAFHGIDINKEEIILDGSEAPVRIDAEALLSLENLAPAAVLNKVRIPYRPVDAKLSTLPAERDKLPSGKQILALLLTYKLKFEEGAEIKPHIPLLNNRIYDNKFESQFYMISDTNKHVYAMGDVYPDTAKLPKGEYTLQLYLRHDNVQYLEKMKQLVLFIEKNLDEKDVIRLSFYAQPDGPVTGNSSFTSSVLVPGYAFVIFFYASIIFLSIRSYKYLLSCNIFTDDRAKEAFYVGPPAKDKLPKGISAGSVLIGAISYGKVAFGVNNEGKNPEKNPVSYCISYIVPPVQFDEDKGKGSSSSCTKSVEEQLEEEVRDAKIRVLSSLKQSTDEERSDWKKLSISLKSEYPKYTPLLAKILEALISQNNVEDKIHHYEEIIGAADEVIGSIDTDELAKYFSLKSDPEDEGAEKLKKKMETTRDQLAEALYQKGLALAEIESIKGEKVVDKEDAKAASDSSVKPDLFEENFKELRKWVDVKSSRYGTLFVIRERRQGRLGTALKVLSDMIQEDGQPPKKKFYDLRLSLLEQIGWHHLVSYEKQWMHVRFPASLPLF